MTTSTTFIAVLIAAGLLAAACGGDTSDDPLDTTLDTTTATAGSGDSGGTSSPEDDGTTEDPPAEDTGTVAWAGTTYELSGDDFGICETVNPAFDEAINIVVNSLEFPEQEEQLAVSGDLPNDVEVRLTDRETLFDERFGEQVSVSRDGRTVTGSASFGGEPLEFEFTC